MKFFWRAGETQISEAARGLAQYEEGWERTKKKKKGEKEGVRTGLFLRWTASY